MFLGSIDAMQIAWFLWGFSKAKYKYFYLLCILTIVRILRVCERIQSIGLLNGSLLRVAGESGQDRPPTLVGLISTCFVSIAWSVARSIHLSIYHLKYLSNNDSDNDQDEVHFMKTVLYLATNIASIGGRDRTGTLDTCGPIDNHKLGFLHSILWLRAVWARLGEKMHFCLNYLSRRQISSIPRPIWTFASQWTIEQTIDWRCIYLSLSKPPALGRKCSLNQQVINLNV